MFTGRLDNFLIYHGPENLALASALACHIVSGSESVTFPAVRPAALGRHRCILSDIIFAGSCLSRLGCNTCSARNILDQLMEQPEV